MSIKESTMIFNLMFIIIIFLCFISFHSITNVTGQESSRSENTTVNITIRGYLDNLKIDYFPVNFTIDPGIAPGTDDNPKQNIQPYLNVSTGVNTNVRWNIFMNASGMLDGLGHSIPVNEIKVNYSCFTDGAINDYPSLLELSYDLQPLCGGNDLESNGYVWIYFFLDVPAGQYNSTYNGDIWIHANSSIAREGFNSNTWYGPGNTTVTIKKRIDIKWTLTPINFGTVNPNSQVNATINQGWPTNITIGSQTNIPLDLYINGTDLSGPVIIDSHSIAYSNATTEAEWPASLHLLNNTLPDHSTNGDFSNWGSILRNTDVFSYWNMSVPLVPGGSYSGSVVAKAVEAGNDPTST
jgi:hypothetical protein